MNNEQNIEQRAKSKERREGWKTEAGSWELEERRKLQYSVTVGSVILSSLSRIGGRVEGCNLQPGICNPEKASAVLCDPDSYRVVFSAVKKEKNRKVRKEDAMNAKKARNSQFVISTTEEEKSATSVINRMRFLSSFGMTARGSQLVARNLKKENSTVQHKFPIPYGFPLLGEILPVFREERGYFPHRRDCINGFLFSVTFNTGEGAEGQAFRACELLLN